MSLELLTFHKSYFKFICVLFMFYLYLFKFYFMFSLAICLAPFHHVFQQLCRSFNNSI